MVRRRWFRFRLRTLILANVVAALLAWINFSSKIEVQEEAGILVFNDVVPDPGVFSEIEKITWSTWGWPVIAAYRRESITVSINRPIDPNLWKPPAPVGPGAIVMRWEFVVLNALLALSMVFVFAWFCEKVSGNLLKE